MIQFSRRQLIGITGSGAVLLIVGALAGYWYASGCEVARVGTPLVGSHGVRTHSGASFIAFEHQGRAVCVPEGWTAVGALQETAGRAYFEGGKTGVLIQKSAYGFRTIEPQKSGYRVEIAYPLDMPRKDTERVFRDVDLAFSRVGEWFGDTREVRAPHTVLVTAALLPETKVYPDPSARVSFYIAEPGTARAQGLLIHAVVHLYNRFTSTPEYLSVQEPFSPDEYAELEATWAETGLASVPDAAFARLNYLYRVHTAVVTQNPDLIIEPPFTDREAFARLRPTVHVPQNGSYLDFQYGHYVLLPLVAAATDALLVARGTSVRLNDLLAEVRRTNTPLMALLRRELPARDVRAIGDWASANAPVPLELVRSAITLYD